MTRLGSTKNNLGGSGNAGGYGAAGDRRARVQLKDLPVEEQNAFALLEALSELDDVALRRRVTNGAGVADPVGAAGLRAVAVMYARLGFPLSVAGIARFKQDRGLAGGTSLGGAVARAYARALAGNEIVVRVEKLEERDLRPGERACLQFLRELAKRRTADDLRPVKKALGLGNPPLSPGAAALENEWVGVQTVKALAHATALHATPLSPEGLKQLAARLSCAPEAAASTASQSTAASSTGTRAGKR